MNLKGMTNNRIVAKIYDLGYYAGKPNILFKSTNFSNTFMAEKKAIDDELLRRLNMINVLREENDELASALRVCKTWFQMHGMQTFNHMECGIADDALSHRMSRLADQ